MLKYCQLPGATCAPWVGTPLLSSGVGTLQPTSPQFASQVHAPQRPESISVCRYMRRSFSERLLGRTAVRRKCLLPLCRVPRRP